ncbi:MAG: hypothetical protein ABSF77_12030 [Spirochaetia bacterium]
MSILWAKITIIGIPLAVSLGWFFFWVLRIRGAARKLKNRR